MLIMKQCETFEEGLADMQSVRRLSFEIQI